MDSAGIETFKASLTRCLATPSFLRDFYNSFMDSSDDVREKFRHTDFPRQTRVLADSLYMMAVAAQGTGAEGVAAQEMARLAERHDRGHLDVRPELYDAWLACLVQAAGKHDPEFTPEIETAWRETLAAGIEYLRSRY